VRQYCRFQQPVYGCKTNYRCIGKRNLGFASVVGLLCLFSALFISTGAVTQIESKASDATVPATSQPAVIPGQVPVNTVPFDTSK
ncbi:MAG: hypothetical protein ACXWWC_12875, partial [Chitinophagaceae bacterium]